MALRMAGRAGAGVYGSREWTGTAGRFRVTVGLGGLLVVVQDGTSGRDLLVVQGDDAAELVAAWERADAELVELLEALCA